MVKWNLKLISLTSSVKRAIAFKKGTSEADKYEL